MKKIKKYLLIILSIFLLSINNQVKAQTYYSEYGPFSDYSEEQMIDSDTNRCEVERHYRWYQEENEGQYFLLNYNDSAYPYLDLSNNFKTDYGDWQDEKPADVEQRELFIRYVYDVKKMQPIRYIYLTDILGNNYSLRITEIQIFNNDQSINYSYYCSGCNGNFSSFIHNGIIKENMSYIGNDGYLRIDLGDYYDANNIVLKISFFDVGPANVNYKIKYTKDIDGPIYFERNYNELIINNSLSDIVFKTITINDLNLSNPEWQEMITYSYPIDDNPTTSVIVRTQYKYRDTYFYYYQTNRLYLDGYYATYNGNYIKDIYDYRNYYRCSVRDKVTIEDNIVINDKDQSLSDFIYDNTTNNYEIRGEVDLDTNGLYQVTYVFPFISISKDIIVDIPDNEVNLLRNKVDELQTQLISLQTQLNEQISINNNYLQNVNMLIAERDDLLNQIIYLNNQLLLKDEEIAKLTTSDNPTTIDELLYDKENITNELLQLNGQLDILVEKINSLTYINDGYITTIDSIYLEKEKLSAVLNNVIAMIDQLNEDVINGKIVSSGSEQIISNLLNSKAVLEASLEALNTNLEEQKLINTNNEETIKSLTEQLDLLKEKQMVQNDNQLDIYKQKIKELNMTIISQNHDLKDIVELKKDEASKYENDILKLKELLKIKDEDLNKIMTIPNKDVNNYNSFNFQIDYIVLIIILLIAIFVVLIHFLYKKNVELK